jgi:hypothetical protein
MTHVNNKKKHNSIVITRPAATVLILATTIIVIVVATTMMGINQSSAVLLMDGSVRTTSKAPSVITGDNVYIAWWNGTVGLPDVQTDVMFRASNDGGATFGDRINLSNSSDADSWRVEIAAEGENVVVSWWETNQTSDIPVARISTDAGETFGPMLRLGANGTIGVTEEEGAEAAAAEGAEGEEEAAAANGGG